VFGRNLPTFREKYFACLFRVKQSLDTHSDNKANSLSQTSVSFYHTKLSFYPRRQYFFGDLVFVKYIEVERMRLIFSALRS